MNDYLLGTLAVLVGGLFCFRGYTMMRIVIPLWGAFVGFVLGAGAVASITGDGFLAGAASWITGVIVAALFSALAYLYYEVSVVIAMVGIGFMLGVSVMVAIGVSWTWLIVLVGIAAGLVLAAAAVLGNLPMLLLTFLTATAGSSAVVGGLMLWVGTIAADDLDRATVIDRIQEDPAWWLLYAFIALAGIISQLRVQRETEATLRAQWLADGGSELRPSS
jgi:hypothetical protein